MTDEKPVPTIWGEDLWVKIVGMLEHNWAFILPADCQFRVFFVTDLSDVFDQLDFVNIDEAQKSLSYNGFTRFQDSSDLKEFLVEPKPPFFVGRRPHPNGPIYSSGKFWRTPDH